MNLFGYSLADLVPFSLETWYALIAAYNRDQPAAVAGGMGVGLVLLWLTARGGRRPLGTALALLGLCWLWIAWEFLHRELGTLLWAADWLAGGFALQGLLLLVAAVLLPEDHLVATGRWPGGGWWLLAVAVLLLPLLAWAVGRAWPAVGWFGTAPDATVIGTFGALSLVPARVAWPLLVVPVIWGLFSAGLLQVLGDPLWPAPLLASAFAPLPLLFRRRTANRATGTAPSD